MIDFFDEANDPELAKRHITQGSDEWDLIRIGRFTSSELFKLMGHGWREMTDEEKKARPKTGKGSKTTRLPDFTVLSKEADTYIEEKVAEVLTGRPAPQSYAYPLVYGKEQEPRAVEVFEQRTGLICHEVGFQTFTDHAGGSPDRLVGDDEGLEIKSPYNSKNQLDYLRLTHVNDIKNDYPQFYWQCVSLLLFTGRKRWHFCTFDPRFKNEKHHLTHLVFEADKLESEFDQIVKAIENAVKKKLQTIQSLQ